MPQFKMPQLGETVSEGTITRWLKKEGEPVDADEALLEVSTDKVDSEIPSPLAGTIAKHLAAEGETVPVGAPIAEISTPGDPAAGPQTPEVRSSGPGPSATGSRQTLPDVPSVRGNERHRSDEERRPVGRLLSPLVRKLAAERKVDLSRIEGTGTRGRITRDDVLRHAGDGDGARFGPASGTAEREVRSPGPAAAVPAKEPSWSAGRPDEVVPLSNMRRLIAEHMVSSVAETARAWNTIEVDMSAIGRLRKVAGSQFKESLGFSLTWTPFVARALTQTLLEFPQVNSTWNGDGTITKKHYVNLGIAVALENGLIVPVIKGADQMNLVGLAGAIRDLAERARNKRLSVDEVREGTFTLTNPGPFGSVMSVPIINRNEAAILAFDAVVKRPVVVSDATGAESIGIREMVFLSLSWDHRLIDGAEAAQFLSRLKAILEEANFDSDLAPYLS